jgi:hypothetical protein
MLENKRKNEKLRIGLLIVLIGLGQNIFAREVKFEKKVDAGALQAQLTSAGFKILWIECSVNKCKIVMPDSEKKDPMSIVQKYVYVDTAEVKRKKTRDLQALYDKWDRGTITVDEKDQLLKEVVRVILGQ